MVATSATSPMSPPNASTSFTRCAFPVPPILGLHAILEIPSKERDRINVLCPRTASAFAASTPACPAPITIASYLLFFSLYIFISYFPTQNLEKILSTMLSLKSSPVILSKLAYAAFMSTRVHSVGTFPYSLIASSKCLFASFTA